MIEKHFYACNVTLQSPPYGASTIFVTYAIASSNDEAVQIATQEAQRQLPSGWNIVHISGAKISRDLLEQVAEEVLGWSRP